MKKHWYQSVVLAFLFMFLTSIASATPQPGCWELYGQITHEKTKQPIVNARVVFRTSAAQEFVCMTDGYGRYSFTNLPLHTAGKLIIQGSEWVTKEDSYAVRGSESVSNYNYTLSHDYWSLSGRVTHEKTKQPIVNARVTFRTGTAKEFTCLTDGNGRYSFAKLPLHTPGKLIIQGSEWVTKEDSYAVRGSESESSYDYTLSHDYWSLSGRVTHEKTKQPIVNATVTFRTDTAREFTCLTDGNGRYSFAKLPLKTAGKLIIQGNEWVTKEDSYAVRGSGSESSYDYTLSHDYWSLSGRVTNRSGQPIVNARVVFTTQNAKEFVCITDGNGRYSFAKLPLHNTGKLTITANGYTTKEDSYAARGSESESSYDYTL